MEETVRVVIRARPPSQTTQNLCISLECDKNEIYLFENAAATGNVNGTNVPKTPLTQQKSFKSAPTISTAVVAPTPSATVQCTPHRKKISMTPARASKDAGVTVTPSRSAERSSRRKSRVSFLPFSFEDSFDADVEVRMIDTEEDQSDVNVGERTKEWLIRSIPMETPSRFTPKTIFRNVVNVLPANEAPQPTLDEDEEIVFKKNTSKASETREETGAAPPQEALGVETVSENKPPSPSAPLDAVQETLAPPSTPLRITNSAANERMSTPQIQSTQPKIAPSNGKARQFTFDKVLPYDVSQQSVFTMVEDVLQSVFEGINATVFTYGQTGAGKTHTMMGSDWGNFETENANEGLIVRSLRSIFQEIAIRKSDKKDIKLYLTFAELHLGVFRDLLDPDHFKNLLPHEIEKKKKQKIEIKGTNSNLFLAGSDTLRLQATNFDEAVNLILQGMKARTICTTKSNENSSRSHVIFILHIETTTTDENGHTSTVNSKLNLVDLAGSERLSKSAVTGEALREATDINQSLSSLAAVLCALSKSNQKSKMPIPFRNSKLTRLLQDSLGGNSRCIMIVCVRPEIDNYQETATSLKYAETAKEIKTHPIVAEEQSLEDMRTKLYNLKKKAALVSQECQQLKKNEMVLKNECDERENALRELSSVFETAKQQMKWKMDSLMYQICTIRAEERWMSMISRRKVRQQSRKSRELGIKLVLKEGNVCSLESNLQSEMEKVQSLEAQHDVLKKKIDQMGNSKAELVAQLEEKEKETALLNSKIESTVGIIEELNGAKKSMSEELESLSKKYEKAKSSLKEAKEEVSRLAKAKSETIQSNESSKYKERLELLERKGQEDKKTIEELKRSLELARLEASKTSQEPKDSTQLELLKQIVNTLEQQKISTATSVSLDPPLVSSQLPAKKENHAEKQKQSKKIKQSSTLADSERKEETPEKPKKAPAKKSRKEEAKDPQESPVVEAKQPHQQQQQQQQQQKQVPQQQAKKRTCEDEDMDEETYEAEEEWEPKNSPKRKKKPSEKEKPAARATKKIKYQDSPQEKETPAKGRRLLPVGRQVACVLSPLKTVERPSHKNTVSKSSTLELSPEPESKPAVSKKAQPGIGNLFKNLIPNSYLNPKENVGN